MASKPKNPENREQAPELVTMVAGWGDKRGVIPEMVPVLEEQGWNVIEEPINKEQEDEAGKLG